MIEKMKERGVILDYIKKDIDLPPLLRRLHLNIATPVLHYMLAPERQNLNIVIITRSTDLVIPLHKACSKLNKKL